MEYISYIKEEMSKLLESLSEREKREAIKYIVDIKKTECK